jgi:hypothetical protein
MFPELTPAQIETVAEAVRMSASTLDDSLAAKRT